MVNLDANNPLLMWEYLKGNIVVLAHMHGQELSQCLKDYGKEAMQDRAMKLVSIVNNGNYSAMQISKYLATLLRERGGYGLRLDPTAAGASLMGKVTGFVQQNMDNGRCELFSPYSQEDLDAVFAESNG